MASSKTNRPGGQKPKRTMLAPTAVAGAQDAQTEDVECPEWGGWIRLRGLTGRERDAFEAGIMRGRGRNRQPDLRNLRARLIVACAIDEEGNRLFSDADATMLGNKSARVIGRLFDAAQRLSGLSDDDIEELTEDFDDAPSGSSTSV